MSALAIIPDGALLIRDGRIEDVGPTRRIERLKTARNAIEVDATGSIVLPGFVDSGTRPAFAHAAGESFQVGISAFADAKKTVLEDNAASVLSGMVRHGTLATEVMTGYGGDTAGELRLMRLYASLQNRNASLITSLVLSSYVPSNFEGDAASWTASRLLPLLATAAHVRLLQSATAMIGEEGVKVSEARTFLTAARSANIHTKIQTTPECSDDTSALLALESQVTVVNGLEGLRPELRSALANSNVILALAPAVTYAQHRDRFAPARDLIDRGGAISLGTNFSREGNSDYNMLHTMSLACRFCGMSAAETLIAATLNAAHAVGCAEDRGSLEPGKFGDLVIFDCEDYSDLVRNSAVHQVSRVLRQGNTVYRRGRVEELQL